MWTVDASGPKNFARMSFSSPMTSNPDSISRPTASEPISPPDPVTIAVATSSIVAFRCAIVRRTPASPSAAPFAAYAPG